MKKLILVFIGLCLLSGMPCQAETVKVKMETNLGDLIIELYPDDAPITVDNFLHYVNSGFYDELIFHRVIENFIVQAGILDANYNMADPCDSIISESNNGLSNLRGTIAMARTDDSNSADSQFFINHKDNPSLDWVDANNVGYCVFGEVISDMNVVDMINEARTGQAELPGGGQMGDVPMSPVIIYHAEIVGDIDRNSEVNFLDFAFPADAWMQCGDSGNYSDWTERAKLTHPHGVGEDWFGYSVAIDGDSVIVGVINSYGIYGAIEKAGATYIFKNKDSLWKRQAKPMADDGAIGDKFGGRVSINGDYAIVGAWRDDDAGSNSGSAYIFYRDGGGLDWWSQEAKITALDAVAEDRFGYSVAIDGNLAVVSAVYDDDNGVNSGSAYVFERQGTTWIEKDKLTASDGAAYDLFGHSVSISGDYIVVGARMDDDNGSNSGSAYIFTPNDLDPNHWEQQAKLTASDGAAGDTFGFCVSVSDDYVVIGAHGNDEQSQDAGAIYVFTPNDLDANNWDQQAKLTASDANTLDWFGYSVSNTEDYIIAGAPGNVPQTINNAGAAYIFKRDDSSWFEQKKLTAEFDGEDRDWFGFSVGIEGHNAIVGAAGDNDFGEDTGTAYIFEICPAGDLNGDCCVNHEDLALFLDNWLTETAWQ